ncbi:uncharacterized protein G2W53_030687 [Senna tora]|uniref:Uncharacterized protein n=1 Tax=Senna tora TaxID=362788 RepID=A0A834T7M6_9FABA|nr:uncharacterized protein G2W53_030687 [Senna tora]
MVKLTKIEWVNSLPGQIIEMEVKGEIKIKLAK